MDLRLIFESDLPLLEAGPMGGRHPGRDNDPYAGNIDDPYADEASMGDIGDALPDDDLFGVEYKVIVLRKFSPRIEKKLARETSWGLKQHTFEYYAPMWLILGDDKVYAGGSDTPQGNGSRGFIDTQGNPLRPDHDLTQVIKQAGAGHLI